MSPVFTLEQVAKILGCSVDALRDVQGLPPVNDGADLSGETVSGYSVKDFLHWGERCTYAAISGTRELIGLQQTADLLNIGVVHLAQASMPGMPRFDPQMPRPLSLQGDLIGFVKQEILAYRDQRAVMAAQSRGSVH